MSDIDESPAKDIINLATQLPRYEAKSAIHGAKIISIVDESGKPTRLTLEIPGKPTLDVEVFERNGVAERDPVGGTLGRLQPRQPGDGQRIRPC